MHIFLETATYCILYTRNGQQTKQYYTKCKIQILPQDFGCTQNNNSNYPTQNCMFKSPFINNSTVQTHRENNNCISKMIWAVPTHIHAASMFIHILHYGIVQQLALYMHVAHLCRFSSSIYGTKHLCTEMMMMMMVVVVVWC